MNVAVQTLIARLKRSFMLRVAVATIALLFFILFALVPQIISIKGKANEVDRLHTENERIQSVVMVQDHSGATLQEIEAKRDKYMAMVPSKEDLSDVLDKIGSRAQGDGLEVSSLKPLHDLPYSKVPAGLLPNPRESVYEVTIRINVIGRFLQLGRYIDNLENSPYKIIIKRVEFKNLDPYDPELKIEPRLSAEITISILMKKLKE